jgi:hypothetical protein
MNKGLSDQFVLLSAWSYCEGRSGQITMRAQDRDLISWLGCDQGKTHVAFFV